MKKFMSGLLAFAMLFGVVVAGVPAASTVEAASAEMPFTDVAERDWFYDEVLGVYEAGIMQGKESDIFAPKANVTRAEIVTIFYRMTRVQTLDMSGEAKAFSDVEISKWYANFVGWAYSEGLVSGYPDGTFKPNKPVLRSELAKLIVDLLRYVVAESTNEVSPKEFVDSDTFGWAAPYIEKLQTTGLMQGDDKGRFNATASATRAEAAAVIYRMLPIIEEAVTPATPLMGFSTWNELSFSINEENIIREMDALVESGLAAAGYNYINIDDGWMDGRDEVTGRVRYNVEKFPNGMKYLADEAHKRGLKIGIYSDVGYHTCGSYEEGVEMGPVTGALWGKYVGLGAGNYVDDLNIYLGEGIYMDDYAKAGGDEGVECWGFDYIKVDSNGTNGNEGVPGNAVTDDGEMFPLYAECIKEIERETGKDKVLNICRWFYPGPYIVENGDMWRMGGDLFADFTGISESIVRMRRMACLSFAGHYADADFLCLDGAMSDNEEYTQFALWCMFSSPLVLATLPSRMSEETKALVTDTELLAINQDPMKEPAAFLKEIGESSEVWVKEIIEDGSGNAAIALYNSGETSDTFTFNLSDVCVSGKAQVRNVTTKTDLGEMGEITVTLESHETVIFTLKTDEGLTKRDFHGYLPEERWEPTDAANYEIKTITGDEVKAFRPAKVYGFVLIDTRSPEDYAAGHIDGAVNLRYDELLENTYLLYAKDMRSDANIVLYGYSDDDPELLMAAYQMRLMYMSDKQNVYVLGAMENYYK